MRCLMNHGRGTYTVYECVTSSKFAGDRRIRVKSSLLNSCWTALRGNAVMVSMAHSQKERFPFYIWLLSRKSLEDQQRAAASKPAQLNKFARRSHVSRRQQYTIPGSPLGRDCRKCRRSSAHARSTATSRRFTLRRALRVSLANWSCRRFCSFAWHLLSSCTTA